MKKLLLLLVFIILIIGSLQVYSNNEFCVGVDDPVDCCTGAGTGTCGQIFLR